MLLVSPIWLQHFIALQLEACHLSPLCLEFLLAKGANMTPISLGLCEIIHGRQLAQCLAHSKHSVKVRHGYYHVDYCYFVIYRCHIGKDEFFSLELQSHLCTELLRAALISLIRWMIDACLLTPRTSAKAGGGAGRAVTLITEGANPTCSTLTRHNEPLLRWDRRLATYIWIRCYNCSASQMWMIPWETEENNPPTSAWQQKSPLQLADMQGTRTEGWFSHPWWQLD